MISSSVFVHAERRSPAEETVVQLEDQEREVRQEEKRHVARGGCGKKKAQAARTCSADDIASGAVHTCAFFGCPHREQR